MCSVPIFCLLPATPGNLAREGGTIVEGVREHSRTTHPWGQECFPFESSPEIVGIDHQ